MRNICCCFFSPPPFSTLFQDLSVFSNAENNQTFRQKRQSLELLLQRFSFNSVKSWLNCFYVCFLLIRLACLSGERVCSSGLDTEIKITLWFTVSRIKINPQAVSWGIVDKELIFLWETESLLLLFVSSCFLYSALGSTTEGLSASEQCAAHSQMPQSLRSHFFVIVFTTSFYFREQRLNDVSSSQPSGHLSVSP